MLTCLHAPFVPPRRLNIVVPEVVTITPENYHPSLPFIRSQRADHLALEGGVCLLTATDQRFSTVTVFCYMHLCCNRFRLHIPPPQRLTITAPFSEVMARTRRRATTSRSSTMQESRSMIQILQNQTIPILESVHPEDDAAITRKKAFRDF